MKTYQVIDGVLHSQPIPEPYQIDDEVQRKIRAKVSLDEELKARRVGGDFAADVDTHIAACVEWGRTEKAAAATLATEWADKQRGESETDAEFITRLGL